MNFFRVPHPKCFILTVLHYVIQSPNSCFQHFCTSWVLFCILLFLFLSVSVSFHLSWLKEGSSFYLFFWKFFLKRGLNNISVNKGGGKGLCRKTETLPIHES